MGSGDRIKVWKIREAIGLGITLSRFPFGFLTIDIMFFIWGISVGIGKAYDK